MGDVGNWTKDATTNQLRGFTPLHAADASPVRLVALQGSVCAYQSGACLPTLRQPVALVSLPKPLALLAGRDVVAGAYQPQNNRPGDLTTLQAGRDIRDVALQVAGVGSAVVEAGRNVSQELYGKSLVESPAGGSMLAVGDGSKNGLVPNLALPHGQASNLVVLAGTSGGMDLDGFAATYLDPTNAKGVAKTYLAELADYMNGLGRDGLSTADLVAAFRALPRGQQEVFLVEKIYFPELRASGIEFNDSTSVNYRKYDRGDAAVRTLFTATSPAGPSDVKGNIVLAGKPAETWAHGDLALVAPYGRIDVGNPSIDTSTIGGGVLTRRGGDVLTMADQDISLYTSRLFTLQGGDVTMWTSNGSITAGSGSKTVVSDVPLSYTMSNDAVVTVNVFGLQTGSGIGVLDALQGSGTRPRSRLDLIAPKGEVNAGDAGIRVVGDLNIAALTVVGVENIQASGASVGVPKVETPNLGTLTAASQAAEASAKEAAGPASPAAPKNTLADLPSIVTVEVVGYETPATPDGAKDQERRDKKKKP
jgi:hypothetical protein